MNSRIVVIAALSLWASFLIGYNIGSPQCYEDEVYAVQEDHDPSHGLKWACVAKDTIK